MMRLDDAGVAGRRPNAIERVIRCEMEVIFAGIGASLGVRGQAVLAQGVLSAIILMVPVTTLSAPVGLRWAFRRGARQ